ncbi:MAG: hypothetical protein AAF562_14785 [Pseudomonadota bacterium]
MLKNLFESPSAFVGQPLRYAMNQVGHAAIGGAIVAMLDMSWWFVMIAYGLFWEGAQLLFRSAKLWDALEDVAFVTSGALIAHFVMRSGDNWIIAAPIIFVLLSGVARRVTENLD